MSKSELSNIFCFFFFNEKELNQQVCLIKYVENEICNYLSQKERKKEREKDRDNYLSQKESKRERERGRERERERQREAERDIGVNFESCYCYFT